MKKITPPKMFVQIAQKFIDQIQKGVLAPGSKVPSVRHYSRQLGVNSATVNRAYWKLENEGFLECRPQSGFYVRPQKSLLTVETLKDKKPPRLTSVKQFNAKLQSISYIFAAFTDPSKLFLCFGFPGMAVLASKRFLHSLRTGITKAGPKGLNYNWPSGYEPLKLQLARHYFNCGLEIAPEKILLTSGCSESMNICFRTITQPGDIVAVESPLFPMVLATLQHYRVKIVQIPIDPLQGMDLDYLKKAMKKYPIKACVAMPNFNNPTGALMPDENKKRLVEMLAEKNAVLIENDIYGDLCFGESRPKPAKAFDKSGNVLLASSFSKVLSPGLRVGWIIAGKNFNAVAACRFSANASTNAFNEAGITDFMRCGEYARHLRKVRKYCETNLGIYSRAVTRYFPKGTRLNPPQGGVLLWLELPPPIDGFLLHREALERDILIFPGQSFSLSPKYKNFISISFGHKWSPLMDQAIETLGNLAKKQIAEK